MGIIYEYYKINNKLIKENKKLKEKIQHLKYKKQIDKKINLEYLENHIKLCKRNMNNLKIKCCKTCPFENIIIYYYPEMKVYFRSIK